MRKASLFLCLSSVLFVARVASSSSAPPQDAPELGWWRQSMETRDERLGWWREARFGAFIHWGVYSALAGVWEGEPVNGYAEHIQRMRKVPMAVYRERAVTPFDPTGFKAEEWIDALQDAGAGYLVITAKHHDGFAMYDSDVSDYNVVKATAWKRDPMRELREVCRRRKMRFGFYYSHAFDWGEPDAPGNDWEYDSPGGDRLLHGGAEWWLKTPELLPRVRRYVDRKAIPQLLELVRKYDPDILWFDTPHKLPLEENLRILRAVREAKPSLVVNGRVCQVVPGGPKARFGDYLSTADRPAEFPPQDGDWEAIPTTNESYGYHQVDDSHKTAAHFIRLLAKAAARGGNLLLNVGPRGDGRLDPRDLAILDGIGWWWTFHSDSIHGTTRTDLPVQSWGESTRNGSNLYLHVLNWPVDGRLVVSGLAAPVKQAVLLSDRRRVFKTLSDGPDVVVEVPREMPERTDSVIRLELADASAPAGVSPAPAADRSRLLSSAVAVDTLRAFDARLDGTTLSFGSGKANDAGVRNWSKRGESVRWPVRLREAGAFDVAIDYDAPAESAGGSYLVRLGRRTLRGTVESSVALGARPLGRVRLAPGRFEIAVEPRVIKGWELMRLRAITLTPVRPRDWRRSALRSSEPSPEIVREDIDGDGKPDILERWWNRRRVRWLDENGDLSPTDTRGDQRGDVLQVDMDGDGTYDGAGDQSIKWADNDGDGRPDVQAFALNANARPRGGGAVWMLFLDTDHDGVLGWEDWRSFDFDCWGFTGRAAWLPDYNGNATFLKAHADVAVIEDPTLNWENPFAFFDTDGDGVSEMAMRWLDPVSYEDGKTRLSGRVNEAFVSFDLDNDAAKDNETDFDLSIRVAGGTGIDYREFKHPLPALRGQPRFDRCFASNNWRRVDSVSFLPREKAWEHLGPQGGWKERWLVFDEDDDDHRWERVEMYYPAFQNGGDLVPADPYSTLRSRNVGRPRGAAAPADKPAVSGHSQADSLGDRGEFDGDDSGKGQLYVGLFDRKLHLAGAEWGAWTVDRKARYHGGSRAPLAASDAPKVEELVRYSDTDGNGFFDTVEYDYDGDRAVDLKVSLLDYASPSQPHPDEVPLIDTRAAHWQGLHDAFTRMANDGWAEALAVYRAAWRRGLTTDEVDRMANAASAAQKYENAYWIKETIFRGLRARLAELRNAEPAREKRWTALEADLTRFYYLGQFDLYAQRIAEVPGH